MTGDSSAVSITIKSTLKKFEGAPVGEPVEVIERTEKGWMVDGQIMTEEQYQQHLKEKN